MRVAQIVAEPLLVHRLLPARQRLGRVEELLESVRLPAALAQRRPGALSGGERQRVGIARALATDPRVLVCDEPVASLDASVGAQVLELLHDLRRRRGLSLVFISHDLRAVASLCEEVAVMYLGRIVEQGPASQLMRRPWHPYTELLLRSASLDLSLPGGGERPSPIDPPSGCHFRTRCPLAEARCAAEVPAWREPAPGRRVSCHVRP